MKVALGLTGKARLLAPVPQVIELTQLRGVAASSCGDACLIGDNGLGEGGYDAVNMLV
jgi:hypothetical protein